MTYLLYQRTSWLVMLAVFWLGQNSVKAQPISDSPCQHVTMMLQLTTIAEGHKAELTSTVKQMRSLVCQQASSQLDPNYRWPSGQTLNLGSNWYYPNGTTAKALTTWYYPNSRILRLGSDQWYYPTGQIAKSGSTWYYPSGQPFNQVQIQPQNPHQENFSEDLQMLEYLWRIRKQ